MTEVKVRVHPKNIDISLVWEPLTGIGKVPCVYVATATWGGDVNTEPVEVATQGETIREALTNLAEQ